MANIDITNKPDTAMNEDDKSQNLDTPIAQPKRKVYPDVNNRLSASVIWLGIFFVVMVFLVQHFSGYS
jgi:hypothetical protein